MKRPRWICVFTLMFLPLLGAEQLQEEGKPRNKNGEAAKPLLSPSDCVVLDDSVVDGATKLSGTVPPGALLKDVRLIIFKVTAGGAMETNPVPDNQIVGTGRIDEAGHIQINLTNPELKEGFTVQLTYQDKHGKFTSAVVRVAKKPDTTHAIALPSFSRGDDRIQGTVINPARSEQTVEVTLLTKKGIVRDRVRTIVAANGNFTAAFSNGIKLACNDRISLEYAAAALDEYRLECPDAGPPTPTVPREGDSAISGKAGDAVSLSVDVFSGDEFIENAGGKADDSGQFSVSFKNKLAPGETLTITGKTSAGDPVPAVTVAVRSLEFDWGRVRAYFAAGVLFSQNDGGRDSNDNFFSRQDFFMSFNIDKNWFYGDKFRVHTFFDARLSALPVHNDNPTPPATTSAASSALVGVSPRDTTTTTTTNASGCSGSSGNFTDPTNSFSCSKKVATLLVGTYMPFVIAQWRHGGRPNNLFAGPVGRVGFSTPTGDGTNPVLNSNRFYTQFAFGGRFGHTESQEKYDTCCGRKYLDKNSSPELISYLDVMVGKFGNFLEVPLSAAACPAKPTSPCPPDPFRTYRAWRASFEGILHIPKTPLIVGFNANTHLQGSKHYYADPPDDLRILFGTRFDVGKLFAKLLNF